jgi:hypothetical protein
MGSVGLLHFLQGQKDGWLLIHASKIKLSELFVGQSTMWDMPSSFDCGSMTGALGSRWKAQEFLTNLLLLGNAEDICRFCVKHLQL